MVARSDLDREAGFPLTGPPREVDQLTSGKRSDVSVEALEPDADLGGAFPPLEKLIPDVFEVGHAVFAFNEARQLLMPRPLEIESLRAAPGLSHRSRERRLPHRGAVP